MVHLNKKKKFQCFSKTFDQSECLPEFTHSCTCNFFINFFSFFCLLKKSFFIFFLHFLFFLEPCIQCETKITLLSVSSLVVKYYTIIIFLLYNKPVSSLSKSAEKVLCVLMRGNRVCDERKLHFVSCFMEVRDRHRSN